MNRMAELDAAYDKYARLLGRAERKFPYGTRREDIGVSHVEFSADGKIMLVVTERGENWVEFESHDVDEVMYFAFKGNAMAHGFQVAFEKRLAEGSNPQEIDDRRIAFPLALERIGKIRQDWRDRLQEELNEILARHPYRDAPYPPE